tara:strand:- start:42 stop:824 length:783 start_codon:yes stop_codon:yes gene_type:complete
VRAGNAQAWFDGIVHTAANGAILGVLGYGGSMVVGGEISAGDLASFLLYSMLVAGNVSAMSSTYADVMRAVGASGRVFTIIDRVPTMKNERNSRKAVSIEEEAAAAAAAATSTSPSSASSAALGVDVNPMSIAFRDVTFAYPLRPEINVLGPHFQLHVQAGESLALVGGSGSGKSTVAALLTRLYDINPSDTNSSGNDSSDSVSSDVSGVMVDGCDVRDMDPKVLRETVGIVSQEPVLFATTIRENIRCVEYRHLKSNTH